MTLRVLDAAPSLESFQFSQSSAHLRRRPRRKRDQAVFARRFQYLEWHSRYQSHQAASFHHLQWEVRRDGLFQRAVTKVAR